MRRHAALHAALPAAAALVALGAAACVAPAPAPRPERMVPDRGWSGGDHTVRIQGDAFYPMVTAEARGDAAAVDDAFRVTLVSGSGRIPLQGVELVDRRTLHAVVPEGLAVGAWDLEVESPDGRVGVLDGAWQATRTRADRLTITPVSDRPFWTVNDTATYEVQLVDPTGDGIHDDAPVRITARRTDGSPFDGRFVAVGRDPLLDQQDVSDTRTLRLEGRLDLAGRAALSMVVRRPGRILFTAEPLGDDVDGAEVVLDWRAGTAYTVQVDLVDGSDAYVAGQDVRVRATLRDEFGNVVDEPAIPVDALLVDACGDAPPVPLRDLAGRVEVDVPVRVATGTDRCPEQKLTVVLGPDTFSSVPFEVAPGPVTRLDVDLSDTVVTAGEPLVAVLRPTDAFGNSAVWEGQVEAFLFEDTVADVNSAVCTAGGTFHVCTVVPTNAESTVALRVSDPASGLEGVSPPYRVVAAALDRIEVDVPADATDPAVAGDTFRAVAELFDRFGNDVPTERFAPGDIGLRDLPHDTGTCTWVGPAERGEIAFDCTLFDAAPEARLTAEGPSATGRSDGFPVINGALDRATLHVDEAPVTAGAAFTLDIATYDAWDNPYTVQDVTEVRLRDTSGTLSIDRASLDADGRAAVPATLTRAGQVTITASDADGDLGASDAVEVTAGAATTLDVALDVPWAWRDADVPVTVEARDAWNNLADLDDSVTLTVDGAASEGARLGLDGGVGAAGLDLTTTSTEAFVDAASDGGLSGRSRAFLVVEDCAVGGPRAALDFDGASEAVACASGSGVAITGDFSASTGAVRHALWIAGGEPASSTEDTVTVTVDASGALETRGLAVDADECATEVVRTTWIGADDGQPVGPLDLSLDDTTLAAGSGTTTVRIDDATACDGTVAERGSVFLRTDRGELGALMASGEGLELSLDSAGNGFADLDAAVTEHAGEGVVHAWVESGAARGTASFTVTDDLAGPRVVAQDPRGSTSDLVSVATLRLSEPVDPDTVDPLAVSLSGPAAVGIDEVGVSMDGRRITILFDGLVDGALGAWTLTLDSTVTDLAGNALDGDFDGTIADHTASFGDVGDVAPDITSCSTDLETFRPDGDDGSGIEADQVAFDLTADTAVSTWVLRVLDDRGAPVLYDRVPGDGRSRTVALEWAGRDLSDRTVPDGRYTLEAAAEGSMGSAGGTCTATVHVDNARRR